MKQLIKQAGLAALFVLCIFAGCIRLPGDSGAPNNSVQDAVTERQVAHMANQEQQPTPITSEPAQMATAPYSVYFGGVEIYEGQVFEGEITHYCDCPICCGPNAVGITADGTVLSELTPGDLNVVGANWLPLGTVVEYIDADGEALMRRVADRGAKSLSIVGMIDEYTPEGHEVALQKGRLRGVEIRIISLPK